MLKVCAKTSKNSLASACPGCKKLAPAPAKNPPAPGTRGQLAHPFSEFKNRKLYTLLLKMFSPFFYLPIT